MKFENASKTGSRQVRAAALLIYFSLLGVYLLTFRGRISSLDNEMILRATESLVERGELAIQAGPGISAEGRDGKRFSRSGLGGVLAGVPFYFLGRTYMRHIAPTIQGNDPRRVFMLLLNAFLAPLLCAVFLLFAVDLGYGVRSSALSALALGLGTMVWPYAMTYYGHVPAALCLLAAAYQARLNARSPALWRPVLIGALLGIAFLFRLTAGVAGVIVGLYFLFMIIRSKVKMKPTTKILHVAAALVPGLVCLGLFLIYNNARFGHPLTTGYIIVERGGFNQTFWEGLYFYLLSPGKSLLLFSPVIVLGIWGWFTFKRRHAAEAWLIAAVALFYLGFHARIWNFNLDVSWGPRFLVPCIPFLLLPLPHFLESVVYSTSRTGRRRLFYAVLVLSVIVTLPGVLVRSFDFYRIAFGAQPGRYLRSSLWVPSISSIPGHWKIIITGGDRTKPPTSASYLPKVPTRAATNSAAQPQSQPNAPSPSPLTPAQRRIMELRPDFVAPYRPVEVMLWNGVSGKVLSYKCAAAIIVLVVWILLGFTALVRVMGKPEDEEEEILFYCVYTQD